MTGARRPVAFAQRQLPMLSGDLLKSSQPLHDSESGESRYLLYGRAEM